MDSDHGKPQPTAIRDDCGVELNMGIRETGHLVPHDVGPIRRRVLLAQALTVERGILDANDDLAAVLDVGQGKNVLGEELGVPWAGGFELEPLGLGACFQPRFKFLGGHGLGAEEAPRAASAWTNCMPTTAAKTGGTALPIISHAASILSVENL